jgi:ribonuclease BN (tRNA processing enzyme)
LKPQYAELSGPEIKELHETLGREAATDEHVETLLVYSADTPNEPATRWGKPSVLIHEATFLDRETAESREQEARHSILPEVLSMAAEMQPAALVLTHFSTRYGREAIKDAIVAHATALHLRFPVHAVLPGEISRDILRGAAVWPGRHC